MDLDSLVITLFVTMVTMIGCSLAHVNQPPIPLSQPAQAPAHSHPAHGQPSHGLHKQANIQDKAHMMEHYENVINPEENMSDEELNFHYFKVHDYDKNNRLDGIELISALTHYHKNDNGSVIEEEEDSVSLSLVVDIVDKYMKNADKDGDGYVSYLEYKRETETGLYL